MPDRSQVNDAASEIRNKVAARAAEIEAKSASKTPPDKQDQSLDKYFVLDCLNRNYPT